MEFEIDSNEKGVPESKAPAEVPAADVATGPMTQEQIDASAISKGAAISFGPKGGHIYIKGDQQM